MDGIKIGIIGGTGLGQLLASGGGEVTRHEVQTPFGPPSAAIIETQWEGLTVLLLNRHGPGHLLNPGEVPSRANIFALKQLGCTHILASGAVGSLRQEYKPRDLVLVDQLIDKTQRRPSTFFESAAVHVDFAEPFCPVLRQILLEAGKSSAAPKSIAAAKSIAEGKTLDSGLPSADGKPSAADLPPAANPPADTTQSTNSAPSFNVHANGCYVCMEGPAFSTRAESLMHRLWGGDLIGMTACPEAKLAREAEIPYALVALVTDYDCWNKKPPELKAADTKSPAATAPAADAGTKAAPTPETVLEEIRGHLHAAAGNAMELIRDALRRIATDPALLAACPAREALKLAIWSDKAAVGPDQIQRLGPIWGRYFA